MGGNGQKWVRKGFQANLGSIFVQKKVCWHLHNFEFSARFYPRLVLVPAGGPYGGASSFFQASPNIPDSELPPSPGVAKRRWYHKGQRGWEGGCECGMVGFKLTLGVYPKGAQKSLFAKSVKINFSEQINKENKNKQTNKVAK